MGQDWALAATIGKPVSKGLSWIGKKGGAGWAWVRKQIKDFAQDESGSVKLPGGRAPEHHCCTDKNSVSTARGGPWTPRFEVMFERAGMSMQYGLNKVRVSGHAGPHPEEYHSAVYQRLQEAVRGLDGDDYAEAFRNELSKIREEVAESGSYLNSLITKD